MGELYTDLAKETYKPLEGVLAKVAPAKYSPRAGASGARIVSPQISRVFIRRPAFSAHCSPGAQQCTRIKSYSTDDAAKVRGDKRQTRARSKMKCRT